MTKQVMKEILDERADRYRDRSLMYKKEGISDLETYAHNMADGLTLAKLILMANWEDESD